MEKSVLIYPSLSSNAGVRIVRREDYVQYLHEHDADLERIVAKVASSKSQGKDAAEYKKRLPVMMPMATLPAGLDKTAENAKTYANGKVFCDFDGYKVDESVGGRLSADDQVLFAQVSASGNGLHVIIKQTLPDLKQCQRQFAEEYGLTAWLDEACKNINRLMFIAPKSHIIKLTDEFFSYNNPITAPAETATDTSLPKDTQELANDVQELFERLGIPEEGERNTRLFKVAIDMRYLHEDVTAEQLVSVIWPRYSFGLSQNEVETTIRSACSYKELNTTIPHEVLEMSEGTLNWMTEEENEQWIQQLEQIQLPKGLHEAVYSLPRHKRMAALLAVLPAFYTNATLVQWEDHFARKWNRLSGMTFVVNQPGGGKQQIFDMADLVIEPLRHLDRESYDIINTHKDSIVKNGKLEEDEVVPHLGIRVHGANFSAKTFADYLTSATTTVKDLNGNEVEISQHLYVASSEAAYLWEQSKKQYTNMKDLMLQSLGSERYQRDYAAVDSVSGAFDVNINWLFCCNQGAFMDYMRKSCVTNGLPTRCMIALFPNIEEDRPEKMKNSTRQLIKTTAVQLQQCVAWLKVPEITLPLNQRLKEWKHKYKGDFTLETNTHRAYNIIGPAAGVLSAVIRNLPNWKENLQTQSYLPEGADEIDRERYNTIPVTDDDVKLAMLVGDYTYWQLNKLFYYPLKSENLKGKAALYQPKPNDRRFSLERLARLPKKFTTDEAIKLLPDYKGDMQQWLHREARFHGTLIQHGREFEKA